MANSKKIAASTGGIIVLVLAIISFVVAPIISDNMGGNSREIIFGKWDGIKIDNSSESPLVAQYRYLKQYADRQNMIPKDAQNAEVFEQQLLYLSFRLGVIQTAIQSEVKNAGYSAPLFRVNKELVNYYRDESGSYSDLVYSQTPETQKAAYRKAIEDSVTVNRYIEDVFGNGTDYGLKTSTKESGFVADMAKKERSLTYITLNAGAYPSSEIIKYGEEHRDLFVQYDFSVLTYPTEEDAKKIAASIQNGEVKFDDAVILNTSKTLTNESGKLIANYRTDINKYFPDNEHLKQILELKPSEISDVVKLNNEMFAIVRCDSEPIAPDFSSEALLANIRSYINRTEKGLIEDYLIATAKKIIEKAKTEGFEKSVENFDEADLKIETTNFFGLNYGNASFLQPLPSQSIFTVLSQNENFFKTVFALKTEEISEPIPAASEVAVFKLAEEKEVDQYTLDSTKSGYENQAGSWLPYYNLVLLMNMQGINYSLPVAQKTFMNYVFDNPKFENNFSRSFN